MINSKNVGFRSKIKHFINKKLFYVKCLNNQRFNETNEEKFVLYSLLFNCKDKIWALIRREASL